MMQKKIGNILLIGKDPAIFGNNLGIGDALERHIGYAHRWRASGFPDAEIKYICYTDRSEFFQRQSPIEGLELIPTRSFCRAAYAWDAWRQIAKLVAKGWTPDLISPQTPWEEGNVSAIASRKYGAKLLPQLHFDLFSQNWKDENWMNPIRFKLAERVLRQADGIRVVSNVLRQKAVDYFQSDSSLVLVSPVPVSVKSHVKISDSSKLKKKIGASDAPLILFVGRFCEQKNLPLWIRVAGNVVKQGVSVQFVMVGEGHLLEFLKKQIDELGLTTFFSFPGKKNTEDLIDYYAAADLFLLTSDYEGYGRVIVEANAVGTPVVSTKSTGPEDLIENGQTGFLTDCGDEQALTERVMYLLEDKKTRIQMGAAAKQKMIQEQSPERLHDDVIDTWRSVLLGGN